MRLSIRLAYLFIYNLFQFCGHTWILANMTARVLTFGRDALADMFYSIGIAMTLCQLLSILELFHIADGLEKGRLLPRFIQVIERNLLLFMVIMLEEFQSKTVVCVQFFLWNILDLLRNPLYRDALDSLHALDPDIHPVSRHRRHQCLPGPAVLRVGWPKLIPDDSTRVRKHSLPLHPEGLPSYPCHWGFCYGLAITEGEKTSAGEME
ncbi:very-long-chain (3R)-3-hydroxyacyl-CoA dehydratase 4 isoform 3-T4 [Polymixia lowei]